MDSAGRAGKFQHWGDRHGPGEARITLFLSNMKTYDQHVTREHALSRGLPACVEPEPSASGLQDWAEVSKREHTQENAGHSRCELNATF